MTSEVTDFILKSETIDTVKESFESTEEIIAIDSGFANFRLLKVGDNINLEYLLNTRIGTAFEVAAQYSKSGIIKMPNQFVEDYNIRKLALHNFGKRIMGFSMAENAVIAAFSLVSALIVSGGNDAKENINGLDMEYYLVDKGELNIYANDRYGLNPNRAIAVGTINNQGLVINPTTEYTEIYQNLTNQKLLSLQKVF